MNAKKIVKVLCYLDSLLTSLIIFETLAALLAYAVCSYIPQNIRNAHCFINAFIYISGALFYIILYYAYRFSQRRETLFLDLIIEKFYKHLPTPFLVEYIKECEKSAGFAVLVFYAKKDADTALLVLGLKDRLFNSTATKKILQDVYKVLYDANINYKRLPYIINYAGKPIIELMKFTKNRSA